ncbi:MAG: transglycosylase domain-containing protein [Microscillaceae bacterium]|nr:transglycosylase domain-containing protein [Microscillaceae bacterium]
MFKGIEIERGRFYRAIFITWVTFLSTILGIVLYFVALNYNFLGLFGEIPSFEILENPRNELASEIYTADNILMGKYYRENRTPVIYEELSPYLVNALIATEDERFERHAGVDLKALLRAVINFGRDGGGSTITQQLAKNLYRTRGEASQGSLHNVRFIGTIISKTKEWLTAVKIERRYTKREIIEMYLNTVPFGHNAYGVHTAAKAFFDKHPSQLNVQESAVLVGMLKAPSRYSPISHKNASKQRRNVVLFQMKENGFITPEQYNEFKNLPIDLHYGVVQHVGGIAPYFRVEAFKFLEKWAAENGHDLYKDGLKIYTTIDSKMQQYAEESVQEHLIKFQQIFYDHWKMHGKNPWVDVWNKELPNFIENEARKSARYKLLRKMYGRDTQKIYREMNKPIEMRVYKYIKNKKFIEVDTVMSPMDSIRHYKYFLQAGFMAMEPGSGHVKAWVGGPNFKHFQYDHVYQGKRQPGSTFKAIIYTAALDHNYTPCYRLPDVPVRFPGGWTPRNANLSYSGAMMTLSQAIATSTNSISAGLIQRIGVPTVIEYARELGIKSPIDNTATICLGTSDVSIFELLGAYCTFPNKGNHVEPLFITRIEDRHGNLIEEFIPKVRQAIDEEIAYQMLHMLMGTTKPGGTAVSIHGYGTNRDNNPGWHNEIAAKTGTTQNNSDAWFMGITHNLGACVWVGGDTRATRFTTISLGQGAVLALPVWGKFFSKLYADPELVKKYPKGSFDRPEELSIELNCAKMEMDKQRLIRGE